MQDIIILEFVPVPRVAIAAQAVQDQIKKEIVLYQKSGYYISLLTELNRSIRISCLQFRLFHIKKKKKKENAREKMMRIQQDLFYLI